MDDDVPHPGPGCTLGHGLGCALRVAIHGAVAHHHAGAVFAVAQAAVGFDGPRCLLGPYGSVRGAYYGDVQAAQLLQGRTHGRAELAEDGSEVAFHFGPVGFCVHLRIEHGAVQGSKAAEGVAREQYLVRQVVAYHRLGPMEHGSQVEAQAVVAQRELVALGHHDVVSGRLAVEALHHLESFPVAHEAHARVVFAYERDAARMVGLHVVNHQVVDGSVADDFAYFFEIFCKEGHVYRVDEGHFFIVYQIRVVRNAHREKPKPLEAMFHAVVYAHVMHFSFDVHSLSVWRCVALFAKVRIFSVAVRAPVVFLPAGVSVEA